jgi:hypothetical protein
LIGELGMTLADGGQVYDVIHPELLAGRPVELDFSGVKVFATPFFNSAIGRLIADIDPARLKILLKEENLTAVGESVLRRVLKNSEEYYRNPEARKALDSILEGNPHE